MTDHTGGDCRPLLHTILVHREDDWSGIADSSSRRKLQNRRNQRTLRARRRERRAASVQAPVQSTPNIMFDHSVVVSASSLFNAFINEGVDLKGLLDQVKMLEPQSPENQAILIAFEMVVSRDRRVGVVRSGMVSNLHQFNFTRALMLNAQVLGLSAEHMDDDDASSLFLLAGPWPPNVRVNSESLPSSLQPTSIQRRVEHHPWIDLLPIPRMRDNILEKDPGSYDDGELCRAFSGRNTAQGTGIIVWREPWDASGWEVTEELARSWGWVIAGCTELFQSTNTWRAQRGQPPLFRFQN